MAHLPPPKMFTHKRIREMLEKYRDDTTVFATETEYYLALYAHEMWQRLNCLKTWTERYRLNTDSIEVFMKRETAKPKANRVDWPTFEKFMHKRILMLHDAELGRREIMDIE